MYCIVGLGNPGKKYEKNRHNAGFLYLDWLANKNNFLFHKAATYQYAKVIYNDSPHIFVKPQTYMNLSGIAVSYVLSYFKIDIERCIVIVDDIALPFGKIRIRANGSSGGHNGLKSIEQYLNSQNYPRIRIGVGEPRSEDLADYVLSDFNKKELDIFYSKTFSAISEAISLIESSNIEIAMSKFNGVDFSQ